ncbi:MAG: ferrochelatase [Mycobacteriales bacterium]|nr:ferrochelatase [Mycobacteriales bacterium]
MEQTREQSADQPYAGIDTVPPDPPPVDALLVVSFGGPEGPDDVLPFMQNVTRGRGIPPERLEEVSRHYLEDFGGVSPINAQARALVAALESELAARGPDLPVYWGNRNWHPFLTDTLSTMRADGRRHALAVVTSAFPSYSGCRQYREDVWRARAGEGPLVTKLRHYYAEEGFLGPLTEGVRTQLAGLPAPRLVFTAHSIPLSVAASSGPDGDGYVTALRHAAATVGERVGLEWDLVFQSRSGPASVPWLEPDVNDHLVALAAEGVREVVLVPVGFTSDHVEVLYDLDLQARETAAGLGLELRRAPTVGTSPAFVSMLRDLVVERLAGPELPDHGAPATHDRCPARCCPAPVRPAARRPA